MYYLIRCLSPEKGYLATLEYESDDPLRDWMEAEVFEDPPPIPVVAKIIPRNNTVMAEFWQVPVPLMTKRLYQTLLSAGVSNIDTYEAIIEDPRTEEKNQDYVAFNIVGKIAAADLSKSEYQAINGTLVSVDFDSLTIDENKTRDALMFHLAESVNGIVVHESVKNAIEAAGIDTLTFIPPEEWVG